MDEKSLNKCKGEWENDCPYPFCECAKYKFKIGQTVWQYINNEDQFDQVEITDRSIINGHKVYKTNIIKYWENETFLSANTPIIGM